jgi:hypothetical protein
MTRDSRPDEEFAMSDPYRIVIDTNGSRQPEPAPARPRDRGTIVRALIWTVLVISAVGNSVSSFAGLPTLVHLGFGVVTAICIVVLSLQYLQQHR